TVPCGALLLTAERVLTGIGEPPEVVPGAALFARIMIPSVLPFFVFIVFRQTLQALGRLRAIVAVIVLANLINGLLDWVLIFGHLGAPAMGVAGSAWATTLSRWAMVAGLMAGSAFPSAAASPRARPLASARSHVRPGPSHRPSVHAGVGRLRDGDDADGSAGHCPCRGAPDRHQRGVADVHGAARGLGRGRRAGGSRGGTGRWPGRGPGGARGAHHRRRVHERDGVAAAGLAW